MSYNKMALAHSGSMYARGYTYSKQEFESLYRTHSSQVHVNGTNSGVSNIMEKFRIPGSDRYVYPSSTDVKYYEKNYDYWSKH